MARDRRGTTWFLVLFCVSVTAGAAGQSQPEPVAVHCEVTRELLLLSEREWTSRVSAAEANAGNRPELERALTAITAEHATLRGELYQARQTSAVAHGRFATDHADEIAQYLVDNAAAGNEVRGLRTRIQALIDRFEALMTPSAGSTP